MVQDLSNKDYDDIVRDCIKCLGVNYMAHTLDSDCTFIKMWCMHQARCKIDCQMLNSELMHKAVMRNVRLYRKSQVDGTLTMDDVK